MHLLPAWDEGIRQEVAESSLPSPGGSDLGWKLPSVAGNPGEASERQRRSCLTGTSCLVRRWREANDGGEEARLVGSDRFLFLPPRRTDQVCKCRNKPRLRLQASPRLLAPPSL